MLTYATFALGILGVVFCVQPHVPCPAPRSPDHGQTFLYQDGSVVKYVCEPGYALRGKELVRCIDGKWEEPNPTCIKMNADESEIEAENIESAEIPSSRPLFSWNSDEVSENEVNDTADVLLSDEARIRLLMYPSRRIVTSTVRTGRVQSATELEEEEKKRSEEDKSKSSTTVHVKTSPSAVHMTVDNGEDVQLINLPRAAVSVSDKGYQSDDTLRYLYWHALHNNYYNPRTASIVDYRTGSPVAVTLTESQLAWIYSLHPDLRDQYLRDMYVIRAEESADGQRAQALLQRYEDVYNYMYHPYIRQPVSLVMEEPISTYDYTCHQSGHSFVKAPRFRHMHIARYDKRQNPNKPNNNYLAAVYRCNPGYVMLDTRYTELYCSKKDWIGVRPVCVRRV